MSEPEYTRLEAVEMARELNGGNITGEGIEYILAEGTQLNRYVIATMIDGRLLRSLAERVGS